MKNYKVRFSPKEISFGLTGYMFEEMNFRGRMVAEKLLECLECYPEYNSKLEMKDAMWVYAQARGIEESWKKLITNFQQGILPSNDECYFFENVTSDIEAKYAPREAWFRENFHELKAKAQAEQILQQLIEDEKLPKIVDIMLGMCHRKEMVLPEYVSATPLVLKKWWGIKDNPRNDYLSIEKDCYELHLASGSQKSAKKYFGIKRCFPCSLALALIKDIRNGINVYEPSREQLKKSCVIRLAAEYGGNHEYIDNL